MPFINNHHAAVGSTKSIRMLFVMASAFSILLITAAVQLNIRLVELTERDFKTSARLEQLAGILVHFDEVITMTAAMAINAEAEDYPYWKGRFDNAVAELDDAMLEVEEMASSTTLSRLMEINAGLLETETAIFAAIESSRNDTARALLSAHRYTQLKQDFAQVLGRLRNEMESKSHRLLAKIDQRERQARMGRRSGLGVFVLLWCLFALKTRRMSELINDYTVELDRRAHYDQLTGVANRTLFLQELQDCLANAYSNNKEGALLIIDLDNFKSINDNLGHPVGDKLLEHVAQTLARACKLPCQVARLGGDEFALLLKHLPTEDTAAQIAIQLGSELRAPMQIDGNWLKVEASIGIAQFPRDGSRSSELLRKADLALYQAKTLGKNGYAHFDTAIEQAFLERQQLEREIEVGIEREEFSLYYQPVVRLDDMRVTGVEALLRWQHPVRGLVAPDKFIPVAEETRQIIPLGQWVYQQACRQARRWREAGLPSLNVSVNLSSIQFEEAGLSDGILAAVRENDLSPSQLVLEITESILLNPTLEHNRAVDPFDALNRLSAEGIKIAIDDFGTGYSSLGYLKRLPIHMLKIDRTFIDGLPTDAGNEAISHAILDMSEALKLEVVAEGIENREQLAYLVERNCNYGQGYYLGKPMTADEFTVFFNALDEGHIREESDSASTATLVSLTPKRIA